MEFVLIYSLLVGFIFVIWLIFMVRMYHKLREKE